MVDRRGQGLPRGLLPRFSASSGRCDLGPARYDAHGLRPGQPVAGEAGGRAGPRASRGDKCS